MKNILLSTICTLLLVSPSHGQQNIAQFEALQSIPQTYAVVKTGNPIEIDGKATEQDWQNTAWTNLFVDIQGKQLPDPAYKTQVKMLWDDEYLYVYAQMEEPHIWGNLEKHDDIIYHNNDFEIFIKPNIHQSEYYEIEVNVLNTIFDLLLSKPYRFGGNALVHWDVKGLRSAVHNEGTVNNPDDTDKYWAVEMAIPFESLRAYGPGNAPKPKDYWQINFSRVQWQHEIQNGKYSRKLKNNKRIEEDNWVWSPIGVINMHYPERWGYIQFVTEQQDTVPELPPYYAISKLSWNIHYLQKLYFDKNKVYTSKLSHLPSYTTHIQPYLKAYDVELLTNSQKNYYSLLLRSKSNPRQTSTVDSKGNFDTNP
ncbi:carbohydrate-binding family 9-like protein [Sphingobacterium spiritivorum]|uniref:carbohydrate-binding family 9-like protein n=1 Tax=Sphingobacterium spiritivorum TaxID=258 RepID=UPI003DA51D9A